METDWIEDIVANKAKVIRLTDEKGGPIHWASALIAGESSWRRILLDNPDGPLIIRINSAGVITKCYGEQALRQRRDQLLNSTISRRKRHGVDPNPEALKKPALKGV